MSADEIVRVTAVVLFVTDKSSVRFIKRSPLFRIPRNLDQTKMKIMFIRRDEFEWRSVENHRFRSSNLDQSRPSVSRFMQIRMSTRRSINLYNLADSSPCFVIAIQISHVNTYSDVKGSLEVVL